MRLVIVLVSAALVLGLSAAASATILNVPADYPTIQSGVDAAADGDTVLVSYGLYTGPGNVNIDFHGKAIVVMSECGPEVTIIDCDGVCRTGCRGFYLHSGESPNSVIQGFTIRNGHVFGAWPLSTGGGIFCDGASPTIIGNIVTCNVADGAGGGISCRNSTAVIVGNTIRWNTTAYDGGGIFADGSSLIMVRNTIAGNVADAGGGIFCAALSTATVINSILWGNEGAPGPAIHKTGGSTVTVTYSDVEGGWTGEGNFFLPPMFALWEKGDVRLLSESPCIDAGHPDSLDPDGTRCDMGAHFFNQDDYLTLYLTPDEPAVPQGGQLGVTYTVINRWAQPETFWVWTDVIRPVGMPLRVVGPAFYSIPAGFTAQRHLEHNVPPLAPIGDYLYDTKLAWPPVIIDEDRFLFTVTEP